MKTLLFTKQMNDSLPSEDVPRDPHVMVKQLFA